MKKKVLVFIALIVISLFLISSVLAVDITLKKASYYPRETLQAEISGSFITPFTKDNIFIYKDNNVHSTPTESGLLKVGDDYVYYAILPNDIGNYFIKIQGVKYYSSGKESEEDIVKSFNIMALNSTYLSINPGFVSTNSDFSIKIKAIGGKQTVSAKFEATGVEKTLSINEETEKTFSFTLNNLSGEISSKIVVGAYEIPVYLHLANTSNTTTNNTNITNITIIIVSNNTDDENDSTTNTTTPVTFPTNYTPEQVKTCSGIGGVVCKQGETCDNTEYPQGIACCTSGCKPVYKSYKGTIWGIIILILLGVGGWWFYNKSKNSREQKTSSEKLAQSAEFYKKRLAGDDKEVKKGLTRT